MNKFTSLVTQNTFFKYGAFIILPLILILIDVSLRFEYLVLMESKGYINYTLSIIYELLLYFVIFKILAKAGNYKIYGIILIAFIISLLVIGVYGHHNYFGVLPNAYSLGYIVDHFDDTLALVSGSIGIFHLIIFLVVFSSFLITLKVSINSVKNYSRKVSVTLLIVFIMMTLFLNNNVRFLPSSYSFSASTLFTFKYFIQERLFGQQTEMEQGYYARKVDLEVLEKQEAEFNLILIIGESCRKDRFGFHGYYKDTSPFVDSLINRNEVIYFQNHFSNTVSTQYSLPLILSGVYALEKHHIPYIYDYIKNRFKLNTFFFSSQSMKKDGFDLVFDTSLDTFFCQENSGYKVFNDRGIDDFDMQESIFLYLNKINSLKSSVLNNFKSHFFGVINFNNSHYPYKVSNKQSENSLHLKYNYEMQNRKIEESEETKRYDNTIFGIDTWMRSLFTYLETKNLLRNTIVIFTSDHGEAFGEHNHSGHLQTLYSEDINVPLWFYIPETLRSKTASILENVKNNSSHLDLVPTILDFYGIYNDSLRNQIQGYSLLRNNYKYPIPIISKDMIDTKGVIVDSMKLLITLKNNREVYELYNLNQDPKENNNITEFLNKKERDRLNSILTDFEKKRKKLDRSK